MIRNLSAGRGVIERAFRELWLLLVLYAGVASAQVTTATLTGIVSDTSGAAMADAQVRVLNTGTNLERKIATDASGEYTVPALAPGTYTVEVEKPGFKREVLSGIVLQVNQEARINVTLQVGQLADSVTVQGAAPLVNSENAMIGDVITGQRVVDMPLNGRNFMQLTLLTGGIVNGGSSNASAGYLAKGFAPSAAGMPAAENNYQLDGADNTEPYFHTYNVAPSVDSVDEFRIQIGQYSAEFGAGGGAVVNVVTKSGTNNFHGAAWEFLRNSDLDARNFFLKPNQPVSPLHQNQFGVAAGGPIVKNRTFIFGDFDLTRIHKTTTTSGNVPTVDQIGGNLSAFNKVVKDPLNGGAPFVGNIIPVSRLSPISVALAKYYPAPDTNIAGQNFGGDLPGRNNGDNYLVKVNHVFSYKENLMGRYSTQGVDTYNPGTFPAFGGQIISQRFQNALLTLTSSFTPTILNEAHFAYSRTVSNTEGQNTGTPVAYKAGVPYTQSSGVDSGFPESLSLGSTPISSMSEAQATLLSENWFQMYDGFTWIRGSHALKAGVDIRRFRVDLVIGTHENQSDTFSGQFTGDGFADFLLGFPSSMLFAIGPNALGRFRTTGQNYYFLDEWKATPSLTLNIGIRYEYLAPPVELSGLTPVFSLATGGLLFPSQNANAGPGFQAVPWYQANRPDLPVGLLNRDSEYTPDRNNFAPRFGFAWRPFRTETTVIRGGYGWYYNSSTPINLTQNAQTGPPSQLWPTYSSAANTPTLTWSGPAGVSPSQALTTATFGLLSSVDPHFLNPYSQQWSLSVDRQLGATFAVDVQYMGSKTTHVANVIDANATTPGTSALATRVPYPKWGRIYGFSSGADANYNALILNAEKRLSHGLAFRASYTWSKALSKGGGMMASGFVSQVQNPLNLRLENGPTSDNTPQRFVATASYDLPFGKGRLIGGNANGFVNAIIGGWGVHTIITGMDGLWFSATVGTQNCNSAYQMTCRPDVLANPFLGGSGLTTPRFSASDFNWPYNTAAHPVQAPRFGNAGPGILEGNGLENVDFMLKKEFRAREFLSFEFRAESFNGLNHTNFSNPTFAVDNPNFGRTFSSAAARQNQLGLKMYW